MFVTSVYILQIENILEYFQIEKFVSFSDGMHCLEVTVQGEAAATIIWSVYFSSHARCSWLQWPCTALIKDM